MNNQHIQLKINSVKLHFVQKRSDSCLNFFLCVDGFAIHSIGKGQLAIMVFIVATFRSHGLPIVKGRSEFFDIPEEVKI